jgi:hypothetical protein
MNRLINRYFSFQTVFQVAFDLLLIFVVYFGYRLVALESVHHAVPATQGISLLAGLLVINTASGLYGPTRLRSVNQWWGRAVVALVLGLLLSYMVFGLLRLEFADHEKLRWLTMLCVAGVVSHRVYAARARDEPALLARLDSRFR